VTEQPSAWSHTVDELLSESVTPRLDLEASADLVRLWGTLLSRADADDAATIRELNERIGPAVQGTARALWQLHLARYEIRGGDRARATGLLEPIADGALDATPDVLEAAESLLQQSDSP
jgi:hypothetical protein